jgi:two-component system, LuxR family, response regulator FixJ
VVSKPKIFVVDSDQPFLQSLSALAESMGLETQVFGSGEEFFCHFDPAHPGCLVLELRIAGLSGLEIQERLAREPIAPPLIFVTAHADLPAAQRAMRLGAVNFLQKQSFSETELWESIQSAFALDRDKRLTYERQASLRAMLAQLTQPERQVLDLLLLGKSNQLIAEALGANRRAIESRRARLMRKLGASNLPDLVRFGIEAGLYRSVDLNAGD